MQIIVEDPKPPRGSVGRAAASLRVVTAAAWLGHVTRGGELPTVGGRA